MPRKQHTHHYIYKTTCLITNRYYVGMHSTSKLNDDYIGSGKRLWYSINKHGRDNHKVEILEFLSDRESLKKREQELVNEDLLKDPMCMNIQPGGGGGWPFKKGTTLTNEHKEKLRIAATNRIFSDETKLKISNSNKGKPKSVEHRIAISNGQLKIECPYCHVIGSNNAMRRWHFENCKQKTNA